MKTDPAHPRSTIGVLAGWQFYRTATNLSYLAPIFRGIMRAARDQGCNLLLGCGMGPSASPADPLRPAWPVLSADHDFVPIGPWNTDGLIVAVPLHSQTRSDYMQGLIEAGHPILFVGSGETGPTISVDNAGGILQAVRHLAEHGHRRIAFIAGTVDDMRGDSGERLRAYQAACEIHGLERDPRLIAYGRHVYDGGHLAMQQIMDSGVEFTAVLASNDESALGAMDVLQNAGRRIPEDVAIIGYDDRLEGAVKEPGLSSIHVPLFNIGYRAVELLLDHIGGKTQLPELVKVQTHLVIRESCGCKVNSQFSMDADLTSPGQFTHGEQQTSRLVNSIAAAIMNRARSLTEDEGRGLSQRMVYTFRISVKDGDSTAFQKALAEALGRTASGDDDTHIWQDAISLMENAIGELAVDIAGSGLFAHNLLSEARLAISAAMQRQHQRYVMDTRWTSSRLSLLTARLQTALDEMQIYDILSADLPNMDIPRAYLGIFDTEDDDPVGACTLRDTISAAEKLVRFRSREFPPDGLFAQEDQFILTLIPLTDQSGQIGFMAFDADHFDLYGSIVQQLGGALNTARLYRQATEGRRLAEEANRMKSRFLSTISHELRTPLNLIVGLSAMVLRDSDEGSVPLPEAVRKDVDRIQAYSQHLGGLIGDVIDLATSDAGQLRLNNDYVDIGQALRIVAESGAQLAADKGLSWESRLPEAGPWIWGDQTRLRQIALNLISNAIKFTPSGGVRLQIVEDSDSVTVMVQDSGMGISPEDQQAIFDEFWQSERSIAQGYGGLGLGLSISRRLVEMHGGTIAVHSSGVEGDGTTFAFTLPTVQPPRELTQTPEKLPVAERTVTVLTRNPETSERLCEHLHRRAFSVCIVLMSPDMDWQAQISETGTQAIILDLSTDSEIGWNTLKLIKSDPSLVETPVLLFSTSQLNAFSMEMDYLTKPIEISELTRALDQNWLLVSPTGRTRTILVVDDEPNTLEMHARIVQSHAASTRVLKARNGKEALEILHREIVDLILLDLQMPEMDGFEVLEVMRSMESTQNIPVIVVTGKVLTEADMTRLNRGVAAVLAKGLFSIEETLTHISSALENKRKLSGESQRLVRAAMAFIHEHFADTISRHDIAQHVGLSEDHLTSCFRRELGTTPIAYLQRYRINQSKRLLKESGQSITEIASDVGFSDSGYFSRIFHRETGISPEAFRRS